MKNIPEDIFSKIYLLLKKERSFYFVSLVYGSVVSLLYLAVPISVQTIITTVSFGGMLQPLFVVSSLLFVILLLAGLFQALQVYTIEKFQRHLYSRLVSTIGLKLLNSNWTSTKDILSADLASRYYDIMTLQKKVSSLVTDFSSLALQIFVGLVFLAFYHPYFIVFDVVFIIFIFLMWKLFVSRGIYSAIKESKSKYNTGNWIFELTRQKEVFQTTRFMDFAYEKLDKRINSYLEQRQLHFKTFFAQNLFILFVYAVMSTFILSLGGYLVIKQQLTVGQLVAAELIVTIILTSVAKSSKHFESFYDLSAAVDKLHMFYELEEIGLTYDQNPVEASFGVGISKLNLSNSFSDQFSFDVGPGEKTNIKFSRLSFKKKFFNLLSKKADLENGTINIGDRNLNFISEFEIKEMVYFCDGISVFHGTIRENLGFNNSESDSEIFSILEIVDLDGIVRDLEAGLDTYMIPSRGPLWQSQLHRFEIAKAILSKSPVMVFGDNLLFVEKTRREKIIRHLNSIHATIIYTDLDESIDNVSTISYSGER